MLLRETGWTYDQLQATPGHIVEHYIRALNIENRIKNQKAQEQPTP